MNKLLRQQMRTRHNNLWVGMYVGENNSNKHNVKKKSLSYRMKAEQRDRLKLEREVDVWEENTETTMTTRT